jgi:hypothetical protein
MSASIELAALSIVVVEHWVEELKAHVPTK